MSLSRLHVKLTRLETKLKAAYKDFESHEYKHHDHYENLIEDIEVAIGRIKKEIREQVKQ